MRNLSIIILLQLWFVAAFAMGIPKPKPIPTPTPIVTPRPTPVPTAAPCASAGPFVDHADNEYVITLQATNGKYVTAECGGDDVGAITANRDVAGEWETFYVQDQGNGYFSIRSSHGRYLSADNEGGGDLHANRTAVGPWELFKLNGSLSDSGTIGFGSHDGAHFTTARLDIDSIPVMATAGGYGPWEQFTVHVSYSPFHARRGVVHAEGRNFVDDEGSFFPLGATMMWALHGWKFDQDRLKQNLQFLKAHHYDYIRILGDVDWSGNEIDSNWPDYQDVLAQLIDFAYDECGLRVEITMIGGNNGIDPLALAQKVVNVVGAGRQNKILDFEVANESSLRPITLQQMKDTGRYLVQNLPNLVSLSSAEGLYAYTSNSGDFAADLTNTFVSKGSANMVTVHMDRDSGDAGWRAVRQPWDFLNLPFPVSHNEPIGPRSSVAEDTDPVRLAMLRAVGLLVGVEAFVLHNGAGVFGQIDPAHNRPANLWEVPGIDNIMDVVRNVDKWLPARVSDGAHWNNAWGGNPWVADAFWGDGDDHGVNRNYTVATPDGWVSTEGGVKGYVVLRSSNHAVVEVFDVIQGKVAEVELQAGQTYTLTPLSVDSNGYGAFIIIGHNR